MSVDVRTSAIAAPPAPAGPQPGTTVPGTAPRSAPARRAVTVPLSDDSRLAVDIRTLVEAGDLDTARDRFEGLVVTHQRRAVRIAYQYLRDAAEADEAVQDAFVKVFSHIGSYREAWPFEVWFTRILVNGCLDRRKARVRRERWLVPSPAEDIEDIPQDRRGGVGMFGSSSSDGNPEARLLGRERRARMTAAIDRLEGRQRTVFMLCHYGDCTPREVSAMIGLNESTVRVHLFRAARKLRALLGGKP
jgi:RNA polymerase sigma-70 factor, ECF subfamily